MVFWLAETPCGAIRASQSQLWIYAIILIMNFLSYFYENSTKIFNCSNGVLISRDPWGAIKASQNPLWIHAIILIMNFLSYFYKNSVLIYNCSNGVLISRDPLRGHQSFTKSIMNLCNYFDNEFSLILL